MIKNSFSIIWDIFRVMILFLGCTLLFYYGILWVSNEYESYQRYDEPKGRAIKVTHLEEVDHTSTFLDRLLFFYHFGE